MKHLSKKKNKLLKQPSLKKNCMKHLSIKKNKLLKQPPLKKKYENISSLLKIRKQILETNKQKNKGYFPLFMCY